MVEAHAYKMVEDGFAPKTIKNYAVRLSAIMAYGISEKCVATNPVTAASLPKVIGKVSILTPAS